MLRVRHRHRLGLQLGAIRLLRIDIDPQVRVGRGEAIPARLHFPARGCHQRLGDRVPADTALLCR